MDPDSNLTEQREIRARLERNYTGVGDDSYDQGDDIDRLVELSEALDDWLSNGGFLPKAWRR